MKNLVLCTALFVFTFTMTANLNQAEAGGRCSNPVEGASDYERQCGIWICLPGGFPSDCGAQKAAFEARLGPGRMSPCPNIMPDYTRCTGNIGGSYTMGRERFRPCREGYRLRTYRDEGERKGYCQSTRRRSWGNDDDYDRYRARERDKQRYIEVTVDGETYPRYWW